jgi:hypothetical protein
MISDISHFNHFWDGDWTNAFLSGVLAPVNLAFDCLKWVQMSTVLGSQVAIRFPGARYIHDIPTFNASSASLGALGAWPGLGPPAYVPPVMQAPQAPQMAPAPGSPQMASPQRAPMSAVPQTVPQMQAMEDLGNLESWGNSPSLSIFAIRIIYPYWGMVISSIADVDAFRCPDLGRA